MTLSACALKLTNPLEYCSVLTPVFVPTAVFTVGLAVSCPPVHQKSTVQPTAMSINLPTLP